MPFASKHSNPKMSSIPEEAKGSHESVLHFFNRLARGFSRAREIEKGIRVKYPIARCSRSCGRTGFRSRSRSASAGEDRTSDVWYCAIDNDRRRLCSDYVGTWCDDAKCFADLSESTWATRRYPPPPGKPTCRCSRGLLWILASRFFCHVTFRRTYSEKMRYPLRFIYNNYVRSLSTSILQWSSSCTNCILPIWISKESTRKTSLLRSVVKPNISIALRVPRKPSQDRCALEESKSLSM